MQKRPTRETMIYEQGKRDLKKTAPRCDVAHLKRIQTHIYGKETCVYGKETHKRDHDM